MFVFKSESIDSFPPSPPRKKTPIFHRCTRKKPLVSRETIDSQSPTYNSLHFLQHQRKGTAEGSLLNFCFVIDSVGCRHNVIVGFRSKNSKCVCTTEAKLQASIVWNLSIILSYYVYRSTDRSLDLSLCRSRTQMASLLGRK